jgi:hypothetical protein
MDRYASSQSSLEKRVLAQSSCVEGNRQINTFDTDDGIAVINWALL